MDLRSGKQVWQAALGELQLQVSPANFKTWLQDTTVISQEDNVFIIGAPSAFAVEWLENRLVSLIKKTLTTIVGETVDVRFIVTPGRSEPGRPNGRGRGGDAPLMDLAAEPADDRTRRGPARDSLAPILPRFNGRYTFDSFIVGSSNRLAHAAAVAVAERPGNAYNPLFIYGGVGLGKTHLLHAIGHYAQAHNLLALYVSSEQFTNEFINAIRERRNEDFRNKYRRVDLLLIDDIQFIAGKEQTQEEFFHTFNDLHSANHQLVISSDRPPRSMPLLEDRLRSRFEWGLIADIQPPDLETRVAILRAKAELQSVSIPPEVLDFVAQKVQSNIRELEGSLNRILVYANLNRARLSVETAARALAEVAGGPIRRHLSPDQIIDTVCTYYGVKPDVLRGRKRDKDIAFPRQVAMYILREETDISLGEIGKLLGGRDHTTVMHGCEKIGNEQAINNTLRRELSEIKESLLTPAGARG